MTGIIAHNAAGAAAPTADPDKAKAETRAEDERIILRIEQLPREMAWLMVFVGVLGVALPGIIGAPFLIAGVGMLAPGGPKALLCFADREPTGIMHAGLKQMARWLDDLERRYPSLPVGADTAGKA